VTLTDEDAIAEDVLLFAAGTAAWPEKSGKIVYPTPIVLEQVREFLKQRYSPNGIAAYDSVQLADRLNIPRPAITRAMREAFEEWPIDERTWHLWRVTEGIKAKYWYDASTQRTERPAPLRGPNKSKGKKKGRREVVAQVKPEYESKKKAEPMEIYAKLIHVKIDGTLVFVDQKDRLIEGHFV
jgi:hypothetical protein